ncbi:thiamine ABC transporter substrate binding subunit [Endozoicomonas sp. SM1973]|uniref:Thiamine ABC transporter substrate binding subunit n=1 Tax=Spartinivicinus marinus TaxID=2994442 RepID=A0A853I413_9GAMM|nr:thiamine ABC transporter substrate binding subunit [Spartinivicinus marinus]MCX4024719.1 thiamine ABC transporter substrate binding subunit [Spartinivicinus marinus]NYZ66252.1 thiamine ABC transporter substrate binding subunit [Spartinivicinus marinus]
MKTIQTGLFILLLSVTSLVNANVLTVYTYQSFVSEWGPGPKLQASFEKQCNCQIKWVGLDDGVSILNRLKLERTKTKADVVIGLDQNLLVEANKLGIFAGHQQDLSKLTLPMAWKNQQFVPYDYGFFAFIYNQERLKQPPQSFAELLADKKLKIIYQDPRTSTPGQGLMLWLNAIYGDSVAAKWQQLTQKTVTVTKGWTEAYGLFLKGEADLVLSYTTSQAYHEVAEQDTRYKAVEFKEGHYPQIEVAAIIKGTQQAILAKQFLQFLLTPNVQQQIATHNWMLPVVETTLPEGFNNIIKPKMVTPFTAEEVAKNRKQWIKQWRQAVVK